MRELRELYAENVAGRRVLAGFLGVACVMGCVYFWAHCHRMAENLSSPSIMILGRTQVRMPL